MAAACQARNPTRTDEAAAIRLLETERPFTPANSNLFVDFLHDAPPGYEPAGNTAPQDADEAQTKDDLKALLTRRFPCDPGRVKAGMDVYLNPIARQKVPEAPLRGALAALTGTLGEPAIDFLLYEAPVTLIHFGIVIHLQSGLPEGVVASAYDLPDGTWQIVFDREYRFNSFASLSALLFHEAFHIDDPSAGLAGDAKAAGAGLAEETVASALESVVYMQMLLTESRIAELPDWLTRASNNHQALILLNSAPQGTASIQLYVTDSDVDIDPLGAEPLTEFIDFYPMYGMTGDDLEDWSLRETEGNSLLRVILSVIAGEEGGTLANADFDQATLDLLDQHLSILSPPDLLTVACILQLDVSCS